MLSIFFAIFGVIGVFLNWPILKKGIFQQLTTPENVTGLNYILGQFSPGFDRLDGKILVGISALLLVSAVVKTRKILLNLKTLVLAIMAAILAAEIFSALDMGLPLYAYTGLLYSSFFYLCAFIASIFKMGSMKSLNSTFLGKPMTESKIFSQTFSRALSQAAASWKIKFTAQDDIQPTWGKGEEREWTGSEIRLGRDEAWANLVIGSKWEAVSTRHGFLRLIGKSLLYEPIAAHYAFAVDGKPYTGSKELPDPSTLTLVSGFGPSFKISLAPDPHSIFHPQSIKRAGEIAVDEFKKLQTTFKILIVMVLLGLPLLWMFLELQKEPLGKFIKTMEQHNRQLNQELESKAQAIRQLHQNRQETQIEISRFKRQIEELKKAGRSKALEIKQKTEEFERYKQQVAKKSFAPELEQIARIIDIKFRSQKTAIYFPVITCFPGGEAVVGTGFFAKKKDGGICLLNEKAVVFDDKTKKWGEAFFFVDPSTWEKFAQYYRLIKDKRSPGTDLYREMKTISQQYNLMTISENQWRQMNGQINGDGMVTAEVKDFPAYLLADVPGLDPEAFVLDNIILYGFRDGNPFYAPGLVCDETDSAVETNVPIAPGFTGGYLVKVHSTGGYSLIGVFSSALREEGVGNAVFLRCQ
jgi:hypothetical protein